MEVGDAVLAFAHAGAFELVVGDAEIVEQADAVAEHDRHDVDFELIEEPGGQQALRDARAVDEDILVARGGFRLPHDLAEVAHVVDEGPVGDPVGRRVAAEDIDRHAVVVVAAIAIVLLKTFDAKFWGVVVMGGAVIILFFLPWLDASPVRSIRYRPGWHKAVYGVLVVFFLVLGYLGIQPPSPMGTLIAQVGTIYYFGFFLLMPWWSRLGAFKPVPDRITFAH